MNEFFWSYLFGSLFAIIACAAPIVMVVWFIITDRKSDYNRETLYKNAVTINELKQNAHYNDNRLARALYDNNQLALSYEALKKENKELKDVLSKQLGYIPDNWVEELLEIL